MAAVVALSVLLTACNSGGYDESVAPPVQGPPPPPSPPPPPQSQFADATASSGINYTNGFINVTNPPDVVIIAPSGVAAGDYDDDGDIDIFIVRGDMGPNLLYRNTGNLVFDEVAVAAGIAYTKSATENYHHSGPMFADLDGDGDLDLFLGGLGGHPSMIYSNNGNGTFSDVTAGSGIDTMVSEHSISAAFGDYDLDGDLDIYHTNGWPRTDNDNDFTFDTSRAFMSDGMGSFENMASDMGLDDTEQGRGIVCADLDADGDVDILQLHRSPTIAATLRRNDTDNNNFLSVKLNGNSPNTQAAGARITVTIGANSQMSEISIASNFVSQNPTVQIFGLGNTAQVDELRVQWPNGSETVMMDIQAGQFMSIDQPAAP